MANRVEQDQTAPIGAINDILLDTVLFLNKAIGIINFAKHFLNFIDDAII